MNKILLILMFVVVFYEISSGQNGRIIWISENCTEIQIQKDERTFTLSISSINNIEVGKCVNYSIMPFTKWVLSIKKIPTELCHW